MKILINKLYLISIFFCLMLGAHAWFVWFLEDKDNHGYMSIALTVVSIINWLFLKINNITLCTNKKIIRGLLLFFIATVLSRGISIGSLVGIVLLLFPLWVLLSCPDYYETIINDIVMWMAVLLIPGLLLHIYILKEGLIPGIPFIYPNNENFVFINYIVMLKGMMIHDMESIRFFSVFLEPSYLGTIIAFLLYTIQYNFRKYKLSIVLVLSLFFTFSLAGYILSFVGFILCQWSKRRNIIFLVPIGLLLLLVYIIGKSYNNGRNYINENVLERLEYDEEKGIQGNNRTGNGTDYYLERSLLDGSFLFGIGSDEIYKINGGEGWESDSDYNNQIRGAGYKVYILRSGLISMILYLLSYYIFGIGNCKNRRYAIGFWVVVFLTFLQAAYPDSFSWIIPYILGTAYNKKIFTYNCKI